MRVHLEKEQVEFRRITLDDSVACFALPFGKFELEILLVWRTLAWIMAAAALVGLAGGLFCLATGRRIWWPNIGLAELFRIRSVLYFRRYRRIKLKRNGQ